MRKLIGCLAILLTLPLMADTFTYPGDNPIMSVTFPDAWVVELDEDVLHAGPADKSLYLGLIMMEGIDNVEAAIEALIEETLSELLAEVEFDDPVEFENNGIAFIYAEGEGWDEEDAEFFVDIGVFSPDGETFCVLFYLAHAEMEEQYEDQIEAIWMSISAE